MIYCRPQSDEKQNLQMSNNDPRSHGGIAPYGYRWLDGDLVINEDEAPVRKLIYELFLKHKRKKTVATLLNDLGYRTRNDALFSDTTINRLLRDTTAKGVREVGGKIAQVEPIIPPEIWERVNNILGQAKPAKQGVQLFTGKAQCGCGGKMIVPSNSTKYVCINCRHKIQWDDLETIFHSQLTTFHDLDEKDLFGYWEDISQKEQRVIIEHICERIIVERDTIRIEFSYEPHSSKTMADGQQVKRGNERAEKEYTEKPSASFSEPLLSEAAAARFLGVSKMTLLRKRNADEISFFRVGLRILYSKEKHLIPFLEKCEKRGLDKG